MVRLALRYYVILQILPWQSVFMSAASTHANAVKLGSAGAAAQALSESSQLCFTLTPVTITHGGSTTTLPSSFQNCQSRPGETTPCFDLFHIFCHSCAVAFSGLCCYQLIIYGSCGQIPICSSLHVCIYIVLHH